MRDLAAVAAVAAVAIYLLTRFEYAALPQLPRLAGVSPVILGVGEAIAGWGLRARIRRRAEYLRSAQRRGTPPPPVPPLLAARALMVAKASALAAAALIGMWIGFAAYVLPDAAQVTAAQADSVTSGVGIVGAAIFLAGALLLESCCRTRDDEPPEPDDALRP